MIEINVSALIFPLLTSEMSILKICKCWCFTFHSTCSKIKKYCKSKQDVPVCSSRKVLFLCTGTSPVTTELLRHPRLCRRKTKRAAAPPPPPPPHTKGVINQTPRMLSEYLCEFAFLAAKGCRAWAENFKEVPHVTFSPKNPFTSFFGFSWLSLLFHITPLSGDLSGLCSSDPSPSCDWMFFLPLSSLYVVTDNSKSLMLKMRYRNSRSTL